MKNKIDKLDFGMIVVHGTVEVYNPLPNSLENGLEIELVSSLEEEELAGVCDTVSEANEYL